MEEKEFILVTAKELAIAALGREGGNPNTLGEAFKVLAKKVEEAYVSITFLPPKN